MDVSDKAHRICRLFLTITAALQLVFTPVAFGVGLSDQIQTIREKQGEVAHEQAQIDLQIQLSSQKLVELQKKINELQGLLNNTIAKRESTEAKLEGLNQKLVRSRTELAGAKARLAAKKNVFKERLVGVYKNGPPNIVEVILGSNSLRDLINRLSYMSWVAQADSLLLREMKSLTATITNQVNEMEAAKKAVDDQRRNLIAQETDIKAITVNIIGDQSRLQEEVAKQQQLYAQKEEEKSQLASAESELRAQAARASMTPPGELRELAVKIAGQYAIPTNIFLNLVAIESGWNPRAVSRAGALGLTQIMPYNVIANGYDLDTFRSSPALQLEMGAKYLNLQYRTFGRWDQALAAYNAGPGAVLKYGGVPPYPETQNYVRRILG